MRDDAEDGRGRKGRVLTRRRLLTRLFAGGSGDPSSPEEGTASSGRIALSALTRIPDDSMMRIVPVLRQGWTANVGEGGVAYTDDSGRRGTVELGPQACAAARLFDGVRRLEEVRAALEADLRIPRGRSVSVVREAFLTLALREVFHPLGAVDLADQEEDRPAE